MLYRKAESVIREHFTSDDDRILVVEGARQVGKSYIVREVAKSLFKNYIEINMVEDKRSQRLFQDVKSVEDFILRVSSLGKKLGKKDDTLIFLDEIQTYPELLTLLKFLREDGRYTYAASGSLLGITLHQTTSVPLGSIELVKMYPLDFEEFLIACGVGRELIDEMRQRFDNLESLEPPLHEKMLDYFRRYLLSGGMPQAVNTFIATHDIMKVRKVQDDIRSLYEVDASQYSEDNKLKIRHLYRLIPSALESKKKRIVFKDIEHKENARMDDYVEEFDYLIDSGIALEVKAVSGPLFPLIESTKRNMLKLYLNDVGLLTGILYGYNVGAVLDRDCGVNLGAVYESVVAQELTAHGFETYYYDNKKLGEVDYLIDDQATFSVVPLEIKSGKDYAVHSALNTFVSNPDYDVKKAYVLCNSPLVERHGKIIYLPIYYIMFIQKNPAPPASARFF